MSLEEELENIKSDIPLIVIHKDDKNPYLGDYDCWNNKTIIFGTIREPFITASKNTTYYFYDGWEMLLSDCVKVSLSELINRHLILINKIESIKKLAELL